MDDDRKPRLSQVHRALADPLRIRLYELLVGRPRSAKELAESVGRRPDRLYHHLAQLEDAKLIVVADYRRLPGGRVERLYGAAELEPPGDDASPADVGLLLNAALETTRADVNAAVLAKQAGENRQIALGRSVLRLNEPHLSELKAQLERLLLDAGDHRDEDGVWTTVLWTTVDREHRRPTHGTRPARSRRSANERRER